ncbi:hypothetical protein GCM10028818_54990 [Spirosoma horti]
MNISVNVVVFTPTIERNLNILNSFSMPTNSKRQVTVIDSFAQYIDEIGALTLSSHNFVLYRGQIKDDPLLPSVARKDKTVDTTIIEIDMLEDFKRRSMLLVSKGEIDNEWDQLVYAQHFGLKTRLLDWTSNPLVALWFAIQRETAKPEDEKDAWVYIIYGDKSLVIDPFNEQSPFDLKHTRVLRPTLNNPRIVAQSGWFTIHRYSTPSHMFVPLETNRDFKGGVKVLRIPKEKKKNYLKQVSVLGVNARFVYPDVNGLCQHLNWKYL